VIIEAADDATSGAGAPLVAVVVAWRERFDCGHCGSSFLEVAGLHPKGFLQKNAVEETAEAIEADAPEFLHVVFGFIFVRQHCITLATESDGELDRGVVGLAVRSPDHWTFPFLELSDDLSTHV